MELVDMSVSVSPVTLESTVKQVCQRKPIYSNCHNLDINHILDIITQFSIQM